MRSDPGRPLPRRLGHPRRPLRLRPSRPPDQGAFRSSQRINSDSIHLSRRSASEVNIYCHCSLALHDGNGNRTRITHPDGSFFPYEYDGLDRFLRTRENGGDILATSTYDHSGRRSRSGWAAATDYACDPAGRLQSMSHDMAGSSGDHVIALAYNPASQIVGRSGSNDAYVFAGHVAAGRRYTVNGLNQYTAAGPASFTYDSNGNLVADGTTAYGYIEPAARISGMRRSPAAQAKVGSKASIRIPTWRAMASIQPETILTSSECIASTRSRSRPLISRL